MSIQRTVRTFVATVKGIDAKSGKERLFEARVTLKGNNLEARAKKALKIEIMNQVPWMLLGPIQYKDITK